ncbi:MAG: TA system VapC family ribonuclease toxin [Bryobacteraceae bacterium]
MSIALLDVNVLVALFDSAHENHEAAHRWFGRNRKYGWATCPLTINGFVRILSNPAYPTAVATPAQAAGALQSFCAATDHHFWEASVTLLDGSLFRLAALGGHRNVTDAYLLGLAVRNHGRLATFDRSIPTKAIQGYAATHLVLIEA